MSEPVKILISVLSTYERGGWPHPDIVKFVADLPFRDGYATRYVPVHNFQPAASGRNTICRQCKDYDIDWLLMLDNDMAPPENLLDTIKDAPADAGIVVPVFYLWDQTTCKLKLCWGLDKPDKVENGVEYAVLKKGFQELSKCGTGAIFIRPSALRKIPYPYFTYLYNEHAGMDGTEDIQFCIRARKAGVKIYGNSLVTVGHYHSVELSSLAPLLNKPVEKSLDRPEAASVDSVPMEAACPAAT